MDMKLKAAMLSVFVVMNGCATATKSTLLGAAIGGIAGGAIGQASLQNSQDTAVSIAVGAGLGSLIGYFFHKDKESKIEKNNGQSSDEDLAPFLTKPKIRSIVVPDSIEGNKYIKAHRVFILEDPGSWSKE